MNLVRSFCKLRGCQESQCSALSFPIPRRAFRTSFPSTAALLSPTVNPSHSSEFPTRSDTLTNVVKSSLGHPFALNTFGVFLSLTVPANAYGGAMTFKFGVRARRARKQGCVQNDSRVRRDLEVGA